MERQGLGCCFLPGAAEGVATGGAKGRDKAACRRPRRIGVGVVKGELEDGVGDVKGLIAFAEMSNNERLRNLVESIKAGTSYAEERVSIPTSVNGTTALAFIAGVIGVTGAMALRGRGRLRLPSFMKDRIGTNPKSIEYWEAQLSDEDLKIAEKVSAARKRLRGLDTNMDASAILEACGDDETTRPIVFRTTVYRERVVEALRKVVDSPGTVPISWSALRRLVWERNGWKLTAFEVKDVIVELANDIADGVVFPEASPKMKQVIATDMLAIAEVVLYDTVSRESTDMRFAVALVGAADKKICMLMGLIGNPAKYRKEALLGIYRVAVRDVVKGVDVPKPSRFASIPEMMRLSESEVESIVSSEAGLGIRDMLESAAAARRKGDRGRALDIVKNAIKVAAYLINALVTPTSSTLHTCDKYFKGVARSVGMESGPLLEDYGVSYGSDLFKQKSSDPEQLNEDSPGILRRLLASADTETVYARAFQAVLEDGITAGLHKRVGPSVVHRLRTSFELPERVWSQIQMEMVRSMAEKVIKNPGGDSDRLQRETRNLQEVGYFLEVDVQEASDLAAYSSVVRSVDVLFDRLRNLDNTSHLDLSLATDIVKKLDVSPEAMAKKIAPICSRRLVGFLERASEAMSAENNYVMKKELERFAAGVSEIVVPLYISIGQAGVDRDLVARTIKRSVPELRLQAILKKYKSTKGAQEEVVDIVDGYVLL